MSRLLDLDEMILAIYNMGTALEQKGMIDPGEITQRDRFAAIAQAQDCKTCEWFIKQLECFSKSCGEANCQYTSYCTKMRNDCAIWQRFKEKWGLKHE